MRVTIFLPRLWVAILAAILAAAVTTAEGAQPVLTQIVPQGGQRGTEQHVELHGNRLHEGPHQVLCYRPGIEVTGIEVVDKKRVKVSVRIAADCGLGRHAWRLRTATGLSNLLTFHVGALREVKEVEPNNNGPAAQQIDLGVVVDGRIQLEDVDVYCLDVLAGERLSVEVEGLRLGRTFFDPVVEVHDSDGNVQARSDDALAAYHDAFVSWRAPRSGRVWLYVREAAFRGNNGASYRLHVGRFPRPRAVFPPVAILGEASEVTWIGDALGPLVQTIDAAATDPESVLRSTARPDAETIEVFPADPRGIAPSALPLLVVAAAPALEAEPNHKLSLATEVRFPGAACGVIQKDGDRDFFRFAARKNQVWDLQVWARRLRSPLDPVLRVQDATGKVLARNDDDRGQPDSYLRFRVPADGEYIVTIEDRLLRGSADMVYALSAAPPAPRAELQVHEHRRYEARVLEVPQGGRTATLVKIARRDFAGPLATEVADLPVGVTFEAPDLAAFYNQVPLILAAARAAPLDAALADISVRLTEKELPLSNLFTQRTWLVRGANNVPVWSHFARRLAVAVTRQVPFSIRLEAPQAPLVQGGEKRLKVIAERREGFADPIRVRMLYNPPGVSSNASGSIPQDGSEAVIPTTAGAKAQLGDWPIVVLGETDRGGRVVVSTQRVTLRVATPYFQLTVPSLNAARGSTAELVVPLEQRTPFDGEAELELLRLPPGVTAEKVHVTAESRAAVFHLAIAMTARVGLQRGVACRVRLEAQGEAVVFTQGYADLHVDPEPTREAAQVNPGGTSGGQRS